MVSRLINSISSIFSGDETSPSRKSRSRSTERKEKPKPKPPKPLKAPIIHKTSKSSGASVNNFRSEDHLTLPLKKSTPNRNTDDEEPYVSETNSAELSLDGEGEGEGAKDQKEGVRQKPKPEKLKSLPVSASPRPPSGEYKPKAKSLKSEHKLDSSAMTPTSASISIAGSRGQSGYGTPTQRKASPHPGPRRGPDATLDEFLQRVTSKLSKKCLIDRGRDRDISRTREGEPEPEQHAPKKPNIFSLIPCEITRSGLLPQSDNSKSNVSLQSGGSGCASSDMLARKISGLCTQDFVPRPLTTPAELVALAEENDTNNNLKAFKALASKSHSILKSFHISEPLAESETPSSFSTPSPVSSPSPTPSPRARSLGTALNNARRKENKEHEVKELKEELSCLKSSGANNNNSNSNPKSKGDKEKDGKNTNAKAKPPPSSSRLDAKRPTRVSISDAHSQPQSQPSSLSSPRSIRNPSTSPKRKTLSFVSALVSGLSRSGSGSASVASTPPPALTFTGVSPTSPSPPTQKPLTHLQNENENQNQRKGRSKKSKSFEELQLNIDDIIQEEGEEFKEKYSSWLTKSVHDQMKKLRDKLNEEFEQNYVALIKEKEGDVQEVHHSYQHTISVMQGSSEKFQKWIASLEKTHNGLIEEKDSMIEQLRNQLKAHEKNLSSELARQRHAIKSETEQEKMDMITKHELSIQNLLDSVIKSPKMPFSNIVQIEGKYDSKSLEAQGSRCGSGSPGLGIHNTSIYQAEVELALTDLRLTVENLKKRLKQIEQEKADMEADHRQEMSQVAERYQNTMSDLNARLQQSEELLNTTKKKHAKEVKDLKVTMLNKETNYNRTFVELKRKYGDRIDNLTKAINKIESSL